MQWTRLTLMQRFNSCRLATLMMSISLSWCLLQTMMTIIHSRRRSHPQMKTTYQVYPRRICSNRKLVYVGNHEIVFLHINTVTQTHDNCHYIYSDQYHKSRCITAILFGQTVGCATSADISYNLSAVTIWTCSTQLTIPCMHGNPYSVTCNWKRDWNVFAG